MTLKISCISYYSYIKPQLAISLLLFNMVVYRTIPTSNHNCATTKKEIVKVVYRTIPTSNHNLFLLCELTFRLYIVLFLHQTTTHSYIPLMYSSCISYYSYIKPQRPHHSPIRHKVVYRTIPTSNHNLDDETRMNLVVVYRTIPTSNHN